MFSAWPLRIIVTICAITSMVDIVHAHSKSRNALNYLTKVENPTIITPSHRVHAHSKFEIVFSLHERRQKIRLSLEPNQDIIAEGASVAFLDQSGKVTKTESIQRNEHRIFKGYTWIEQRDGGWNNIGWARISLRRDGIDPLFEGAFTILHDHHHIQLHSNYMQTKHEADPHLEPGEDEYMVVFRDSDIGRQTQHTEFKRSLAEQSSCSANFLSFNSDSSHPVYSPPFKRDTRSWGSMPLHSLFGKRQIDTSGIPSGGNSGGVNLSSTIGNTAGCPSTRKVALIGVATDCSYTASFSSNETARQNVLAQINSASEAYEKTFNITLALQNLTVSDANCPGTAAAATPWNIGCGGNTTITDRLNTFSQWRGERNDSNAYWTLLTNCPTGAEVGLAWLGQACVTGVTQGQGETVSGANVVARTSTEWQVIAHESGHTFGAVHDCDSQTCSDGTTVAAQQCCPLSSSTCDASGQFIMNPSTASNINSFSACTVGNICSAFLRNSVKSSCLSDNKGVLTIAGHQCGNGVVEEGEQCDCGGPESCGSNSCCDATTCQFKNNAVCDDSNEDCCKGCQFASSGTICRASTGVCDPQETCSGSNATCPPDETAPNGQSCGNSLQCASGQCTSRDQQCKTLMGSYTSNNDTYACNSQDCTLSCASPSFGPGTCYSMQQNFLDGTPCGGGGSCSNGQCTGSSTLKEVGSWISSNKPLVIGLAAGIGGLLLILILGCLIRCCRRPRRSKQQSWPQHTGGWGAAPGGYWQQQPQHQGLPPRGPPFDKGYATYHRPSVRYA